MFKLPLHLLPGIIISATCQVKKETLLIDAGFHLTYQSLQQVLFLLFYK
jgi:hypothetical protein